MSTNVTTLVGFGAVLDPVEFAAALASLHPRPPYQGSGLAMKLPAALARAVDRPEAPRVCAFRIVDGDSLPVATVTLQVAGTQIVCLVPLVNAEACNWLVESVEKQGRVYVFAQLDGQRRHLVMHADKPLADLSLPRWVALKKRLPAVCNTDRLARFSEMCALLEHLEAQPRSVLPGFEVQACWVFVCVPYSMHLAMTSGEQDGAPPVGAEDVH